MLLDDCLEAIKKDIEEQPDLFEGRTFEDFKISEGHVRDDDHASNYYMIGLRTNPAETHVAGVLGDGMIWYKFPWCVTGTFRVGSLCPSWMPLLSFISFPPYQFSNPSHPSNQPKHR